MLTTRETFERMQADAKMPNAGGWRDRHNDAVRFPKGGMEFAIVHMIRGWLEYAETHKERYESQVGDDGVIGAAWADAGKAIHSLLDGETGRLDCGTLSTLIHATMKANGIESEE